MRLAVVHYAVAVLVVAKSDRGIKLRTFVLWHRPHFPSTYLATAITNGGTTAIRSLSPVHDRSKSKTMKTRLSHSCHLTRKPKLELVL
jgi:hypothetical protein